MYTSKPESISSDAQNVFYELMAPSKVVHGLISIFTEFRSLLKSCPAFKSPTRWAGSDVYHMEVNLY